MATIKFVLKDAKADKPTPILALIRFDNKRVNYSIGYSINPNFWNSVNQRAFEKNSDTQLKELRIMLTGAEISDNKAINTRIGRFIDHKSTLFSNYEMNRETPTTKEVKKDFDKEFRPSKVEKQLYKNLNDYIDHFVEEIKSGERLTDNGTRYNYSTVKMYKSFNVQFQKYQKEKRRIVDFENVDMNLYNDYVKFLRGKNYSTNTIGKHITLIKRIMNASLDEKYHTNTNHNQKAFKGISEQVDSIYLSFEELEKLYNLDLSRKLELETARDVFLVGCFTALRFSDYSRIKPHHIQKTSTGNRNIRIETKKTGEEVIIPLWHWILDELIKKYPEGLPKTYEQKVNKRIKEIGLMAKFTQPITKVVYKEGRKFEVTTPKYKQIMTHTARRSGATNMYKHGIPTIDIMKITGHKKESIFLNYIKVTKEETAERIAKDYRINKPLKKVN